MKKLPTPQQITDLLPIPDLISERILAHRVTLKRILTGKDPRMALCLGPCSVHNADSMLEYAKRLKKLINQVSSSYFIVLRAYLEKPRTTTGWKGYIYDPFLDGTHQLENGLILSRKLLIELTKLDIPLAVEILDPFIYPYIQELISWGFIGARTCTSSTHRQMASHFDMPIGFKNSVDGNIDHAIHGILSAKEQHSFIGLHPSGFPYQMISNGNPYAHLVLRGGNDATNYDALSIKNASEKLRDSDIPTKILIDCSHGNSGKQHEKQKDVFLDVLKQKVHGNSSIAGMMIESFLKGGNQSLGQNDIDPHVSITDSCLSWEDTEDLILSSYESILPLPLVSSSTP